MRCLRRWVPHLLPVAHCILPCPLSTLGRRRSLLRTTWRRPCTRRSSSPFLLESARPSGRVQGGRERASRGAVAASCSSEGKAQF